MSGACWLVTKEVGSAECEFARVGLESSASPQSLIDSTAQELCGEQFLIGAGGVALDEGGFGGEAEHFEETRLDALSRGVDFVDPKV